MNFYEWIFIIQLLICLAITFLKVYNIMCSGEIYDIKISFLTFGIYALFFGLGFMTAMFSIDNAFFVVLVSATSILLIFNLILTGAEIMLYMKDVVQKPFKAYTPKS